MCSSNFVFSLVWTTYHNWTVKARTRTCPATLRSVHDVEARQFASLLLAPLMSCPWPKRVWLAGKKENETFLFSSVLSLVSPLVIHPCFRGLPSRFRDVSFSKECWIRSGVTREQYSLRHINSGVKQAYADLTPSNPDTLPYHTRTNPTRFLLSREMCVYS